MLLSASRNPDSFMQFISVLLIFVFVLAITLVTTRWIAKFEKSKSVNRNIEVLETCRITANKYIQIVRLGDTYVAIAVCKDTVSLLAEVPKEQIEFRQEDGSTSLNFKDLLDKARKVHSDKDQGPKKE